MSHHIETADEAIAKLKGKSSLALFEYLRDTYPISTESEKSKAVLDYIITQLSERMDFEGVEQREQRDELVALRQERDRLYLLARIVAMFIGDGTLGSLKKADRDLLEVIINNIERPQ